MGLGRDVTLWSRQGWPGLPDFLGETGREGREDEGELRWSEVSLGLAAGGAGARWVPGKVKG